MASHTCAAGPNNFGLFLCLCATQASREVVVPKGVSVTFKNRVATVKGPRGSLKKSFRHLTVNIITTKNDRGDVKIKVEMFFANRFVAIELVC